MTGVASADRCKTEMAQTPRPRSGDSDGLKCTWVLPADLGGPCPLHMRKPESFNCGGCIACVAAQSQIFAFGLPTQCKGDDAVAFQVCGISAVRALALIAVPNSPFDRGRDIACGFLRRRRRESCSQFLRRRGVRNRGWILYRQGT